MELSSFFLALTSAASHLIIPVNFPSFSSLSFQIQGCLLEAISIYEAICIYLLKQARSSFRSAFSLYLQPPIFSKGWWAVVQNGLPGGKFWKRGKGAWPQISRSFLFAKKYFSLRSSFPRTAQLSQPAFCSMLSPYLVTSSCSSLLLSFVFYLLVLVLLLPPAPFNLEQLRFAQHGYSEINQVWKVRLCCAHILCFLPSTPSVEKYVQNCCEVPQWRAGTKLPSQSSSMPLSCTETHTQLTTNRMPTVNKNKKCLPTQHASTLVEKKREKLKKISHKSPVFHCLM